MWVEGKREKWIDEGDTESVISLTVPSEMSRSKCRYDLSGLDAEQEAEHLKLRSLRNSKGSS